MIGALIIAAVLVAIGLILYLDDLRRKRKSGDSESTDIPGASTEPSESPVDDSECCGQHLICEKQNEAVIGEIEYYDDEELDILKGRDPESYTEAELEMLRDVVLTLRREDAVGWSVSLERRGIRLPDEIRDELMLLLQ